MSDYGYWGQTNYEPEYDPLPHTENVAPNCEEAKKGIQWTCSQCGCDNTDYYHLTAIPMCENCDHEFDWGELLMPGTIVICRDCHGEGLQAGGREYCVNCDGAGCLPW